MMPDQEHPVLELDSTDSWNLLAGSELGRIAVSVGDVPEIFPVNYLAHEGIVLFCTAEGSKLVNLTINRHVAFETDGFTEDFAWSVIVHGTAEILPNGAETEASEKLLQHSWIPTVKYVFVAITPEKVTGRRFARGPAPDRW
jgi:uncharacterized protein